LEETVEEDEILQVLDLPTEETNLDNETIASPSKMLRKKKGDEESLDDRFKLRNGKEIFEEKAYLVGVERKGDGECLFNIEESLEELEQLADTAGLAVVGSTYQKLVVSSYLCIAT
jgi:GTP-binding protein HflX